MLLSRAQFDSVYDAALKSVSSDIQVTRRYLETLKRAGEPLTNLQLARIGYLQMKTFEADGSGMENSKAGPSKAPDSLRSADSLPFYARRYLERFMPDMAIPLLMKALKILPEHSPDADHAMNALINQSDIFQKTNDFKSAFGALERATQLAPVWENRNLYMRIYLQYASLYTTISEYRDAYGF